jgi:hypothetical protein
VTQVSPTVDEEGVRGSAPLQIKFSKRMIGYTLSGLGLTEYRGVAGPAVDSPWYRWRFTTTDGKTVAALGPGDHRAFGPNSLDYYYFASIPSTIKSDNQNCLYPGYGPGSPAGTCTVSVDQGGVMTPSANCVSVTTEANRDTGCAQLTNADQAAQANVRACLDAMKLMSPS